MSFLFPFFHIALRLIMLFRGKTLFKIDYLEGYNLNFEITEEQARSLLPDNLKPLSLKLLECDEKPAYYLSWYLASMDTDESKQNLERVDLFTYGMDQNDEFCLFFISSIMELPEAIKKSDVNKKIFSALFDFFARDSRTGKAAYPHYYTQTVKAKPDSFVVKYNDSTIQAREWKVLSDGEQFDRTFVLANSQIYRNEVDKNVNFFNQRFMSANVKLIDLKTIETEKLQGFHPLCENLVSAHYYGSKEKPSTWYFEI